MFAVGLVVIGTALTVMTTEAVAVSLSLSVTTTVNVYEVSFVGDGAFQVGFWAAVEVNVPPVADHK